MIKESNMTDQIEEQDVELLDEMEVEEAHDPKNAEAQSLAANDAAEDIAPKAKSVRVIRVTANQCKRVLQHQ